MGSTLVFDGDCGFCTTTADWIAARVADDVEVVPWQNLDLDQVGLSEEQVTTAAWWLDSEEGVAPLGGASAVGAALEASGWPWRAIGVMCRLPVTGWVAERIYRLIARYRYRLPGGTPACRIEVQS